MSKKIRIGFLALLLLASSSLVFGSQSVFQSPGLSYSFVSYLSVGGGTAFIQDEKPLVVDASYGFQLSPWFSLGAFVSTIPLSNFDHADLGLSIADTQAAFALSSGTELLFTISSDRMVHPIIRLAVGGINVGYLEDIDDREGYDVAHSRRSTFASVSAGLELNLTKHTCLAVRGGWRFAAHDDTMGIQKYGLSGPEVTLHLRTVFKTDINKK